MEEGFTIIVSASMKVARRHATRRHEAAAKVKTGGGQHVAASNNKVIKVIWC